MDGGASWATVHGITESDTTERLNLHFCGALPREGRIISELNFSRSHRKYIFSLEGSLYCPWRLETCSNKTFFFFKSRGLESPCCTSVGLFCFLVSSLLAYTCILAGFPNSVYSTACISSVRGTLL